MLSDKNIQDTILHIKGDDREPENMLSIFKQMPSFKTMSDGEATAIAGYLLELKSKDSDVDFIWERTKKTAK